MTPTTLCPQCGYHLFAFDMGQLVCNECKYKISPIQHIVAEYVLKREKRGEFVVPKPEKALLFAVTELGEAVDSYLRGVGDDGFVRNNERQTDFAEEVGDVIFMLIMAAWLLDVNVEPILWKKFNRKLTKNEIDSSVSR